MVRGVDTSMIVGSGLANLSKTAHELLQASLDCKIWLFKGEMGSGKTTLIKAVCKELGLRDLVSSPTFSIINEYKYQNEPLYHFDFYRIKNLEEAVQIGIEEYFYSKSYCFIEWPELIMPVLSSEYLVINIEVGEGETREYKLTHYGID